MTPREALNNVLQYINALNIDDELAESIHTLELAISSRPDTKVFSDALNCIFIRTRFEAQLQKLLADNERQEKEYNELLNDYVELGNDFKTLSARVDLLVKKADQEAISYDA